MRLRHHVRNATLEAIALSIGAFLWALIVNPWLGLGLACGCLITEAYFRSRWMVAERDMRIDMQYGLPPWYGLNLYRTPDSVRRSLLEADLRLGQQLAAHSHLPKDLDAKAREIE